MKRAPPGAETVTSIRAPRRRELPDIAGLLRACGLTDEGVGEHLQDFLVLTRGGRIVGVGGLEFHGPDALLRSLAVAESTRRTGLGARLCAALTERAGGRDIYLLTLTAQAWFGRRGFVRIAREVAPPSIRGSAQFAALCPATAVLMRRCGAVDGGAPPC